MKIGRNDRWHPEEQKIDYDGREGRPTLREGRENSSRAEILTEYE
jgi:hypothetical protein